MKNPAQKNPHAMGHGYRYIILAVRISCAWQGHDGPDTSGCTSPRSPPGRKGTLTAPLANFNAKDAVALCTAHTVPTKTPRCFGATPRTSRWCCGPVNPATSATVDGRNCFLKFTLETGTATPEFCLLHEKRAI